MFSHDSRLSTFLTGLSSTSRQQLRDLLDAVNVELRPAPNTNDDDLFDVPATMADIERMARVVPPLTRLPLAPRASTLPTTRKGPGGYDFTDAVDLPAFTCDVVTSPHMDPVRGAAGQELYAKALLNVKGPKGGLYLFAKQAVLGLKGTATADRARVLMRIGAKHWPNLEAGKQAVDCYVTFAGEREAICIGALTNLRRVA